MIAILRACAESLARQTSPLQRYQSTFNDGVQVESKMLDALALFFKESENETLDAESHSTKLTLK